MINSDYKENDQTKTYLTVLIRIPSMCRWSSWQPNDSRSLFVNLYAIECHNNKKASYYVYDNNYTSSIANWRFPVVLQMVVFLFPISMNRNSLRTRALKGVCVQNQSPQVPPISILAVLLGEFCHYPICCLLSRAVIHI